MIASPVSQAIVILALGPLRGTRLGRRGGSVANVLPDERTDDEAEKREIDDLLHSVGYADGPAVVNFGGWA